jgi:hypothetical protein
MMLMTAVSGLPSDGTTTSGARFSIFAWIISRIGVEFLPLVARTATCAICLHPGRKRSISECSLHLEYSP